MLVPCPNATGQEHRAAQPWQLFDRIIPARSFWSLLLRPKRFGLWPKKGIVVFLGGDQFWTVLLSARLGYRHITYAEWVALLPGSKAAKLSVGMPFFLETADHIAQERPECRFLLPLAPTTSVEELLRFAGPTNPIAARYRSAVVDVDHDVLITKAGTRIQLIQEHPAHGPLSQCDLALTTVGANTAELGALAVPMIVMVPTQHLDMMRAWDGGFGLLARIPGLRRLLLSLIHI